MTRVGRGALALLASVVGRSATAQPARAEAPPVVLGAMRCPEIPAATFQWNATTELGAQLVTVPPAEGRWLHVTVECVGTSAVLRVSDRATGRSLDWHIDLEAEAPSEYARTLALNLAEAAHAGAIELTAPPPAPGRESTPAAPAEPDGVRTAQPVRAAVSAARGRRRRARPAATRRPPARRVSNALAASPGLLSRAGLRSAGAVVPAAPPPEAEPAVPAGPVDPPRVSARRKRPPSANYVELVFGLRSFVGGAGTLWGGGARYTRMFTRTFGASAQVDFEGASVDDPLGVVVMFSTSGALAVLYKRSVGVVELQGRAGVRAGFASLAGEATAMNASAATVSGAWTGPFAAVEAGVTAWRRLRVGLAAEGGYVLLPVVGTSQGQPAASIEGLWLGASARAGLAF